MRGYISERGFQVHVLPMMINGFEADASPAHSGWAGAHWKDDAIQTQEAIVSLGCAPDWLIVDHYALDWRWETVLRPFVGRIFVIDDLADRKHDCDAILDQNLLPDIKMRYEGLLPDGCRKMLGPEYALLQSIYSKLHGAFVPRSGPVRRIVVSFGGVDNDDLTGLAVRALSSICPDRVSIDVIVSSRNQNLQSLLEISEKHENIHVCSDLPTLAHVFNKADLAIGASGTSTWERLCLGLPSIVLSMAENQKGIAEELDRIGLVDWIGHIGDVTAQDIIDSVQPILDDGLEGRWSMECHRTVDGLGTLRATTLITITSDSALVSRRVSESDESMILEWANDVETRRSSFSTKPISADEHHRWFHERLGDCFFIVETDKGVPIGQVRFEETPLFWELHYSLNPLFRGMGLGSRMLSSAIGTFARIHPNSLVVGNVKEGNHRSCRIFESLGFVLESEDDGVRIYCSRI